MSKNTQSAFIRIIFGRFRQNYYMLEIPHLRGVGFVASRMNTILDRESLGRIQFSSKSTFDQNVGIFKW